MFISDRFLKFQLHIIRFDNVIRYGTSNPFRIAVVDLDRAKDYPMNFVCVLPKYPTAAKSEDSKFSEIFGKNNVAAAKKLLIEALENENNDNFKPEIKSRLKLLEHHSINKKKCVSCSKIFPVDPKNPWQRFCENCI